VRYNEHSQWLNVSWHTMHMNLLIDADPISNFNSRGYKYNRL